MNVVYHLMKKKIWDLEELLKYDHYRSILYLTKNYQYKENGLKQIHFRWALIDNHDNIDQTSIVHQMGTFFSSSVPLNLLYEEKIIVQNCIKGKYANNNLSNFLLKLTEHYNVLQKNVDKDGFIRYKITEEINKKLIFYDILENLKQYDDFLDLNSLYPNRPNVVCAFDEKEKFMRLLSPDDFGIKTPKDKKIFNYTLLFPYLFGLDHKFFEECSDGEKKKIIGIFKQFFDGFSYLLGLNYYKTGEKSLTLNLGGDVHDLDAFLRELDKHGVIDLDDLGDKYNVKLKDHQTYTINKF